MNNRLQNIIDLKERLMVLKFLKPTTKKELQKIIGEIRYVENTLLAAEFSTNNDFATT